MNTSNKIGVSYNCFSATELLPYSIAQIRKHVNHIVCIIQKESYQNIPFYEDNKQVINDLFTNGLIDDIIYYDNTNQTPKQNECNKRNLGKNALKKAGCTHFLTMDEDELYKSEQFERATKQIIKSGFDSSACQMQTYYKSPRFRVVPPESYFVPFLYKLDDRVFKLGQNYPVLADPSRKLQTTKHYSFNRLELEMFHYSYIRKDIRRKLFNSASAQNYGKRLTEIANYFDLWTYPNKAYLGGSKKRLMNVEEVPNHFEINI